MLYVPTPKVRFSTAVPLLVKSAVPIAVGPSQRTGDTTQKVIIPDVTGATPFNTVAVSVVAVPATADGAENTSVTVATAAGVMCTYAGADAFGKGRMSVPDADRVVIW